MGRDISLSPFAAFCRASLFMKYAAYRSPDGSVFLKHIATGRSASLHVMRNTYIEATMQIQIVCGGAPSIKVARFEYHSGSSRVWMCLSDIYLAADLKICGGLGLCVADV